ncbi:PRAME family member 20/21 [Myotis brandtii]|uniref:PRAME family member 20/21 n=1 Tax=Myotis brandtii TaxID=109478 RepID=S7NN55_MYOBR|nr:PRAME family member 20/21 [Myotis brandtii]
MSIRTPPTLLKLAAKRLLRDQASAIAALEYLPAELFPYLFAMAYRGGRRPQLLKALAQAWPFTVLPLGVLMQRPPDHAPTRAVGLKAVFDAIDVVLAQEVLGPGGCSRRCKLRVLDLRNTGANFWDMWLRVSTENCSWTEPVTVHSSSPSKEHPLTPLEVFLDLTFNERGQDKFFMHIIQWAQQREGLLHLCCKTLRTSEVPFQRVRKVLDRVRLDCIQDVKVNTRYLHTLRTFALYLGAMSNLQKLFLLEELTEDYEEDGGEEEEREEEAQQEEEQELRVEEELEREEQEQEWEEAEVQEWEEAEVQEWEEAEVLEEGEQEEGEQEGERQEQEEQQSFSQFLSQMLMLRHLQQLYMCALSFLPGRLNKVLRCLQTPLDKLCLMFGQRLTHSDLTYLFQCPNLRQLKFLYLCDLSLGDFSEPLRALLEAVVPTLQGLGLDKCGMGDSQVEAILPVLSRCHQLRHFTIFMNNFSVATMEKLLRHTTWLRSLEREVYPIPLEGYSTQGIVNQERLALIQAELTRILRELGQPRTIHLGTKHRRHRKFYKVAFS